MPASSRNGCSRPKRTSGERGLSASCARPAGSTSTLKTASAISTQTLKTAHLYGGQPAPALAKRERERAYIGRSGQLSTFALLSGNGALINPRLACALASAEDCMSTPSLPEIPPLVELRREIDRLDEAMHNLLIQRGEIIDRLIKAKQTQESGSAFRPAREAQMMRRLVERH